MSNNSADLMLEKSLRDELNHVLLCEEIMWAQRAKTNWLQLGDKNTKFFQTVATIRKKMNEITKVKDENGFSWSIGQGFE